MRDILQQESGLCSLSSAGFYNRMQSGNSTSDKIALYKTGVSQFKLDTSRFLQWCEGERWLARNSLLAVAGGNDGLAGLRRDTGFKQFHDQLLRKTHFVFSAQTSDREYFLDKHRA